jgi:hypothetical protein
MYRPTRLVQGATNLVSAFPRISRKMLNSHLGSMTEIFIDDVSVRGPKSRYSEEEVDRLPGVSICNGSGYPASGPGLARPIGSNLRFCVLGYSIYVRI